MTTDRLCTLSSLTEKARALTNAAAELMDADALVEPSYMESSDYDKKAKAWEVLRTHDTCGWLLLTLLDIFEHMDAEINGAELDEMNAQKLDPVRDQSGTAYTLKDGTRLADFARSLQKLTPEQLEQLDGSGDALPDQRGGAAQ